ncbi:hypothetical protein PTKIN_Ptkin09bG0086300 [Pterospermum kingtungense]
MEVYWSPQDAMKAYLNTLHLVQKCDKLDGKPRVIEPKCIELISALAAGRGAKSIVEITTEGITPLTIALGVAAKQSGGQLICIIAPSGRSSPEYDSNSMETKLADQYGEDIGLGDVVKLVHADDGTRACEMIMQLNNIDFAVIDSKFDGNYLKFMFKKLVIPNGSAVMVLHNLQHDKKGGSSVSSFAQLVKRWRGVESVTLPIGEGIELTKILGYSTDTRFHVTFHN